MSEASLSARILERAARAGVAVQTPQLERLARYYELLSRWNDAINMTALPLRDFPDSTLDRLIVEPLMATAHVPGGAIQWLDVGSGNGSPAIPMKIMNPQSSLTMVESKERKAAFLREAVRTVALENTSVVAGRFEDVAGTTFRQSADLITVRAVRIDEVLIDAAAATLAVGGRLFVFSSSISMFPNDLRFGAPADVSLAPLESWLAIRHRVK